MAHKWYHWMRLALMSVAVIAVLLGMAGVPARTSQAQSGGVLGYGSKVFGTISVDAPQVTYSFTGSSGDLVTAIADTWTGALDLQVDLIAPDGLQLSQSTQNMPGGDPMGAYLSVVLPDPGIYLLRVSGVNGTTGDFLLTLLGRAAATSTPLVYGQAIDVTIPQNAQPQFFSFDVEDCPTTLVVTNQSPGQPFTFPFVVKVRDQRGQNVTLLRGGEETEDWVTVAPRSGRYEVEVLSVDPALSGTVRLLVTCSGDNPGCLAGQAGIAGVAGLAECRTCPGPGELLTGGGCPDLNLAVQQGMPTEDATTVSWDPMPGADGYAVYVYGKTPSGGEVYLTHADWIPGDPTMFSWILPVEGYTGYRFVLQVVVGGSVVCSQEVSIELERTNMGCPDFGLTGAVTDEAVNAVTLNWATGLGADQFELAMYSIIEEMEGFIGALPMTGDTTSRAFDHFPPEFDGVRFVLWMTRGDMLCSAEITIMFGGEQVVCPDLGLSLVGHDPAGHTFSLAWFSLEGIAGYELDIYGTDASGAETLLGTVTGLPAGATGYSYAYPEGYVGFRFVLRTVGGPIPCSDELALWPQNQPDGGPCAVTSLQGAPVHVGPGRSRAIFGFMEPGVEYVVTGQAADEEGNLWWQLDKTQFPGHEDVISLWVMQSDVTPLGECTNIPTVEIPPIIPEGEDVPPGTWGPCGSCDTCGFTASECVTSPEGACLWDPATCRGGGDEPPPGEDGGDDGDGPPPQQQCYGLGTSVDPVGTGYISVLVKPNCGNNYNAGTSVQVSANPNSGCWLDQWSGCGAGGSGNPVSITMNSSCTITAHIQCIQ